MDVLVMILVANFSTEAKSGLRYGKYPTYNEGNTNDIKTENKRKL